MKTQCPHCKAKFKTPEEYTGKKVKCPKCKKSFVCAELIEPATPRKQLGNTQEIAEKCENCGRVIGKLEQPCVYKDNVVCQQCNEALRNPLKAFSQEPVRVTQTKSTSGFGVAALVLGIIACLTCWIPFVGLGALPLALLGVLFGILGIIASIVTRRSYVGLPIAGTIVSGAAALIFVFVTGVTTKVVTEALESARDTINAGVEDTTAEDADKKAKEAEEKRAYISKVKIVSLQVAETILDDWGVFGEIENAGDRTLSEIEITIYYLDEHGEAIYEDTFHPVLTSGWSSNKPLKPNYSEKFGYEPDDVPSNWAKKVKVYITNIEFAKTTNIESKYDAQIATATVKTENKDESLEFYENVYNNPDMKSLASSNAMKLRMGEDDNFREILYKLKLLAIDDDTVDTREYHSRINKLEENHKFRLEVIDFFGGKHLLADPHYFGMFLDVQKKSHQSKLEYIKLKITEAFDEVEEGERKCMKAFLDDIHKWAKEQEAKSGENK